MSSLNTPFKYVDQLEDALNAKARNDCHVNKAINDRGFTRKFLSEKVFRFGSLIIVSRYISLNGCLCHFIDSICKVKGVSFCVLVWKIVRATWVL